MGKSTMETSQRERWWRTWEWGINPQPRQRHWSEGVREYFSCHLPSASGRLNWFARAVVAKHHKLGGLNNGPVSSYSSGGKKPEIKMLARPRPPAGAGAGSTAGFLWLLEASQSRTAPSTHGVLCVCMSVSKFPIYKVTSHIEWGPTPFQYDQFLTNYVSVWACLIASIVSDSVTLSGSLVHGILQARILEWVAISYFRGSSQPRDPTHVSCIGRWVLYHCTSWEAQLCLQWHFFPDKVTDWGIRNEGFNIGTVGGQADIQPIIEASKTWIERYLLDFSINEGHWSYIGLPW